MIFLSAGLLHPWLAITSISLKCPLTTVPIFFYFNYNLNFCCHFLYGVLLDNLDFKVLNSVNLSIMFSAFWGLIKQILFIIIALL